LTAASGPCGPWRNRKRVPPSRARTSTSVVQYSLFAIRCFPRFFRLGATPRLRPLRLRGPFPHAPGARKKEGDTQAEGDLRIAPTSRNPNAGGGRPASIVGAADIFAFEPTSSHMTKVGRKHLFSVLCRFRRADRKFLNENQPPQRFFQFPSPCPPPAGPAAERGRAGRRRGISEVGREKRGRRGAAAHRRVPVDRIPVRPATPGNGTFRGIVAGNIRQHLHILPAAQMFRLH